MSIPPFIKGLRNLLSFAENNRQINTINIGGGIGVKLLSSDDIFNMVDFATQLKQELELFNKHDDRSIKLQIECGSYYVRNSGVYVCRVANVVKKGSIYIYYTDGSAFHLLGNKFDRQVKSLKTSKMNHKSIIVGATCSALDVISDNVKIPKLNIGDLLLVPNSGAYCAVQSNNFNMIPTPKEILL